MSRWQRGLAALWLLLAAAGAWGQERILAYHADIEVKADGGM